MLLKGAAKKVTIYVNEDTQRHLNSLYESILMFLMHKGVAGATATRAIGGFGGHRVFHTPNVELLAEHLPIRIEFIDSAEKVEEILPTLYDMVNDGIIEIQDTHVVKVAMKDKRTMEPKQPHTRKAGSAKLMRIFLGEADRSTRARALLLRVVVTSFFLRWSSMAWAAGDAVSGPPVPSRVVRPGEYRLPDPIVALRTTGLPGGRRRRAYAEAAV